MVKTQRFVRDLTVGISAIYRQILNDIITLVRII